MTNRIVYLDIIIILCKIIIYYYLIIPKLIIVFISLKMMITLVLQEILISPPTALTSSCNMTLNSDILAYSSCEASFEKETVFDFNNRIITVLGAPLDTLTCSRYLFRMNNTVIKNANFFLNATVEYDNRCPK